MTVNKVELIRASGRRTVLTPKPRGDFQRLDIGQTVPDDGGRYVMAQHEIILFGTTRHSGAQPSQTGPRPAVVNRMWGIQTLATGNGDYVPIPDLWQRWFFDFWDWASGYRLPHGEMIGTYKNPRNPNILYTQYTPGSKLALYAGMIMDAKSHTDSVSPETGGRDVVTGRNLESSKPWAWLCRPCTGAVLRVKEVLGRKLKIEALDLWQAPPPIEQLKSWQFYFGTQVHIDGRVTRYPDVKEAFAVHGWDPAGTAMPLVAPGGYFYIDRDKCVELKPGQVWTPYHP